MQWDRENPRERSGDGKKFTAMEWGWGQFIFPCHSLTGIQKVTVK